MPKIEECFRNMNLKRSLHESLLKPIDWQSFEIIRGRFGHFFFKLDLGDITTVAVTSRCRLCHRLVALWIYGSWGQLNSWWVLAQSLGPVSAVNSQRVFFLSRQRPSPWKQACACGKLFERHQTPLITDSCSGRSSASSGTCACAKASRPSTRPRYSLGWHADPCTSDLPGCSL